MIKLSEIPTRAPLDFKKEETKRKSQELAMEIGELGEKLHAEKKHSLLVVFQGMDSSGKDGATRKIFRYCSPAYASAKSFKKPTDEEFSHDFLWRVTKEAPPKGNIKIFIRSHYEDVLIQRVHNWIDEKRVTQRINAINSFEELLINDNNTKILKFYMHLSHDRQEKKLQERIDNPTKQWKHNPTDWEERKHWNKYMHCYEDAINRSSIPWIVAPVDQRWYRDFFIASKIIETLKELNLKYPTLTANG